MMKTVSMALLIDLYTSTLAVMDMTVRGHITYPVSDLVDIFSSV